MSEEDSRNSNGLYTVRGSLGLLPGALGASWGPRGGLLGGAQFAVTPHPWCYNRSWGLLGASWGAPGSLLGAPGGHPGGAPGGSWGLLGALMRSWLLLGQPGDGKGNGKRPRRLVGVPCSLGCSWVDARWPADARAPQVVSRTFKASSCRSGASGETLLLFLLVSAVVALLPFR